MRVLLIRLSALGDVLTATPTASLIHEQRPDWHVTWLIERQLAPVLAGNPAVDQVIAVPTSRDWRRLATRPVELLGAAGAVRRALAEPFDVVVDLQGLAKSAAYALLARAPRKIRPADAYEPVPGVFTETAPRRVDPACITSMYVSLLEPLGLFTTRPEQYRMTMPLPPEAVHRAEELLSARGLAAGGYVALVPGTTRPQKHWHEAHWPRLAGLLQRRLGLPCLWLGGPDDLALVERLSADSATPTQSLAGATSLAETAALLAAARAAVTVDTGPMHIAVAVGCPTVAIYGSTPPRWFGPTARYAALWREFPCAPCMRRPTCRHFECLTAVRPEDVVRRLVELLDA